MHEPGLVDIRVRLNLRGWLRPVCHFKDHRWMSVIAGDAFSRSYRYCHRCGEGWMKQGA